MSGHQSWGSTCGMPPRPMTQHFERLRSSGGVPEVLLMILRNVGSSVVGELFGAAGELIRAGKALLRSC